jgi:hypothetical protein
MIDSIAMIQKFHEMPEYQRLKNIRQFSLSLKVFSGNTLQLKSLLDFGKDPKNFVHLGIPKKRPELQFFQLQIVRLLHNFVASAKSLVDHSRRFYQDNYKSNGQFKDYEEQVKIQFAENPLAQFVNCFRQYCQHYEPPPIGSKLNILSENPHAVFLTKKKLLKFDKWNAPAKTFLQNAQDQIDLYDIVLQYEQLVSEFYAWVNSRLMEIHSADCAIVEQKNKEIIQTMTPSILQELTIMLEMYKKGVGQPEDVFVDILDANAIRSVMIQFKHPTEQAKAMIAIVQQYISVPQQLQDDIINIFEKQRTS